MTTCIARPFALVAYGGSVAGQKPRTKLGFLTDLKDGKYSCHTITNNGGILKTPRWIGEADVYQQWRSIPTAKQVKLAKARLKP